MGQAVLEWRSLVSDSLAVSMFDHAWLVFDLLLRLGKLPEKGDQLRIVGQALN
jgi:hypothetical protein